MRRICTDSVHNEVCWSPNIAAVRRWGGMGPAATLLGMGGGGTRSRSPSAGGSIDEAGDGEADDLKPLVTSSQVPPGWDRNVH